jgi:predicted DNA-binding transcriptional regulator YafY
MRAGDQLFQLRSQMRPIASNVPGVTTASTLSMLRDAVRAGDPIWLSYVDDSGRVSQHAIEPISVAGGMLRGHDLDTGALESFALHHIAAVNLLDDDL